MVWKPRVTVAAVIENEGRFLLVEENTSQEPYTVFNQPAGHLEEGESLIEAVIRETWEETAHSFSPQALTGIYRWIEPNSGDTYLRISFTGTVGERRPEQPLDDGIIAPHWLSLEELQNLTPRLRSPLVQRCIDDYLNGQRFPLNLLSDVV